MKRLFATGLLALGACCAAEPDQWENKGGADPAYLAKVEAELKAITEKYDNCEKEKEALKNKPAPKITNYLMDPEFREAIRPYWNQAMEHKKSGELDKYAEDVAQMRKVLHAYKAMKEAEEKLKDEPKKEEPKKDEKSEGQEKAKAEKPEWFYPFE